MRGILINACGNDNWIGGLYYAKNIAFELSQNDWITRNYKIVVYTQRDNLSVFKGLPDDVIVLNRKNRDSIFSKLFKLFYYVRYNIKYSFLGSRDLALLGIKNIYWIPDFQHKYYPNFFSSDELNRRTKSDIMIAKSQSPLVLSSYACLQDFKQFYSKEKNNVYVVPFVSYIEPILKNIAKEDEVKILEKYDLNGKQYICIMNQFWQHKNHMIIFRAMEKLFQENPEREVFFVFTGKLEDYRNPNYINTLRKILEDNKVNSHTKILGYIERTDQVVLMKNAEFIIQPSLFEGWGTVVEDAKILDKTVILSDIPVHREQKNTKCILFNPSNYQELTDLILDELNKPHVEDSLVGIQEMYKQAKEYSKGFERLLKEENGG